MTSKGCPCKLPSAPTYSSDGNSASVPTRPVGSSFESLSSDTWAQNSQVTTCTKRCCTRSGAPQAGQFRVTSKTLIVLPHQRHLARGLLSWIVTNYSVSEGNE